MNTPISEPSRDFFRFALASNIPTNRSGRCSPAVARMNSFRGSSSGFIKDSRLNTLPAHSTMPALLVVILQIRAHSSQNAPGIALVVRATLFWAPFPADRFPDGRSSGFARVVPDHSGRDCAAEICNRDVRMKEETQQSHGQKASRVTMPHPLAINVLKMGKDSSRSGLRMVVRNETSVNLINSLAFKLSKPNPPVALNVLIFEK
jgi:hypothetical protein